MNFLYLTTDANIAKVLENNGIDFVFFDMEYRGKEERQEGLDLVLNKPTFEQLGEVRNVVNNSKLLVRANPIGDWSNDEINKILEFSPDVIMLPYFKEPKEVKKFIQIVDGRSKISLLFETPESLLNISEILEQGHIDYAHFGLNDLTISLKRRFIFEILAYGILEPYCETLSSKKINFGIGGVGTPLKDLIPSPKSILAEHRRLGSSAVILARSFCNYNNYNSVLSFEKDFTKSLNVLKSDIKKIALFDQKKLEANKTNLKKEVKIFLDKKK